LHIKTLGNACMEIAWKYYYSVTAQTTQILDFASRTRGLICTILWV